MAYPPMRGAVPYQPAGPSGYGTPSPRDGITAALMNINNPAPGYLAPPGVGGGTPPFGGIPGGAQPQAALGPAAAPMGPMGPVGGPATPGLNLPGVTQPGALPQSMNPQATLAPNPAMAPAMQRRAY
jgi:hypothetical protein